MARSYDEILKERMKDSLRETKKALADQYSGYLNFPNGPSVPKIKTNKPSISLLPFRVLAEVAKAMQWGLSSGKYVRDGWRLSTNDWSDVYDAGIRHVGQWWDGEELDPESGVSHLAHGICNFMFLLYYSLTGARGDNRFIEAPQTAPVNEPEPEKDRCDCGGDCYD
jgi:hypothetical protein